ncbi:hypothetical protein OIV83_004103 [Microbotryomycetes sp. JL201]|nr:hypothetical protein OIV83_004103 [Microbotryomycetes sp. JL201]
MRDAPSGATQGASPVLGPLPNSQEYTSIIQSIHQRTSARSTVDLAADLALSAQLGQQLLDDKNQLERRLAHAEAGTQKVLDKLTLSVKEASQLQRRLEETVSNLEQADHNNRSLLVTLEEDRKTISRLSAEAAKHVQSAAQLKSLMRTHEDVKQELASERKRSTALDARLRKQTERCADLEKRWKRATSDLEEMRQDKVLRTRKSHDALAKYRAKYSGPTSLSFASGAEALAHNPEAAELLKLVETLVSENDMLRSESQELHELLDVSRDEQVNLLSDLTEKQYAFLDAEEGGLPPSTAPPLGSNLLADVLNSPSVVQSVSGTTTSDFDESQRMSPASTAPTSHLTWANSTVSHSHRSINLSRTLSSSSAASNEDRSFVYQLSDGRKTARRSSGHFAGLALGPPISTGKIPVGKGHNRRSASIDISSVRSLDVTDGPGPESLPVSPYCHPPARPPSLFSIGSEGDDHPPVRPRRHHRPLSLSMGPSMFPLVPEDEQAALQSPRIPISRSKSPRLVKGKDDGMTHSSSTEMSVASAPSGMGLSSPQKRPRTDSSYDTGTKTVDSATQTSPVMASRRPSIPSMSTPKQTTSVRSASPRPEATRSHTSLSELSDQDRFMNDVTSSGNPDSRTISLNKLLQHASKLLSRIQSSDIASQEKRLKKQHLSGDVGHLAQTNLKDIIVDVENLRHHFRKVLEAERIVLRGAEPDLHANESLVLRRDFVTLVKLFRDILFELSRLRMLVNRVQLDPHLASSLRALDVPNNVTPEDTQPKASAASGLLAPLTRFLGAALSNEPEPTSPTSAPLGPRPHPPKRSVSSAISSTAVSVEFGSGAVRRAVANENEPPRSMTTEFDRAAQQASLGRKGGQQARRDLNSIFAGAPTVVAPKAPISASWFSRAGPSSNPIGRLLASYRPATESTVNAVLDSIPHAPQSTAEPPPPLLERELRRRGLSDSSIRSTFVAHANPHHRIISPATLALSGEPEPTSAVPILVRTTEDGGHADAVDGAEGPMTNRPSAQSQLSASLMVTSNLSKRPSVAQLRSKKSTPQLRSVSATRSDMSVSSPPLPVQSVPVKVRDDKPPLSSIASAVAIPRSLSPSETQCGPASIASTSLLGNLSQWASKASGLSPLAAAVETDEDEAQSSMLATSPRTRPSMSNNLSRSASGRVSGMPSPTERAGRDC